MQPEINENDLFDELMSEPAAAAAPAPELDDEPERTDQEEPADDAPATEAAPEASDEIDEASLPEPIRRRFEELKKLAEPELREKHLSLTKDYAALYGKTAPLQRRLAETERELAQLRNLHPGSAESGKAQPGPNTATPVNAAEAAAAVGMTPDQWTKHAEMYPEDAKAVQSYVDSKLQRHVEATQAAQQRIAQLESQLTSIIPDIQKARWQADVSRVATAHPDYEEIGQRPEFWQYVQEWIGALPPHLQGEIDLIRDSNNPDFVIPRLNEFKRLQALSAPASAPPPPNRTQAATTAAHRLATAPNVRGNPPPRRANTVGMDPNDEFDAIAPREWAGQSR